MVALYKLYITFVKSIGVLKSYSLFSRTCLKKRGTACRLYTLNLQFSLQGVECSVFLLRAQGAGQRGRAAPDGEFVLRVLI